MSKPVKILLLLLCIAGFIAAGFFREKMFYEINARIKFLEGYPYDYNDPAFKDYLADRTVQELIKLKWFWTSIATAGFFVLSFATLHAIERSHLARYLIYLFLGLIVLSGLAYGAGILLDGKDLGYRISRIFMGFLQSPLPLLILIPAAALKKYRRQN